MTATNIRTSIRDRHYDMRGIGFPRISKLTHSCFTCVSSFWRDRRCWNSTDSPLSRRNTISFCFFSTPDTFGDGKLLFRQIRRWGEMHKGCGSAINHSLLGFMQVNTHISTLWVPDESGIACVVDTNGESDAVPWHI